MLKRWVGSCFSLGACMLAAPATAQDAQTPPTASAQAAVTTPHIEYVEWHLDNGLQVIAIPDDTTSTVFTSMWYKVGAKLDPEGRAGFAHLFEHILSRKTRNMPYNLIYRLTADNGGTRNASNSMDRTNYHETMPAQFLETMLWTHRERMAFPVVDAQVFENERAVVKEELRTRVFAPPYGRISRLTLPEISYDLMPHRRPSIGSIEDLDAASLEDGLAFHEAYYGPDTAALIVAGNFDVERLRILVDTYFADIAPRANPFPTTITVRDAPRTSPRVAHAFAPNIPMPAIGTIWQLPGTAHPDAAVMDVLEAIMGRGDNSRFETALIRSGLALQMSLPGSSKGEVGTYGHLAFVSPDGDLAAAKAALDAEMELVRNQLVSEAELNEAKNEIIASALRRRETAAGRARELGEYLVRSGDAGMADLRLARIAATTREDIRRVAQTYLTPVARTDITIGEGEWNPADFANPVPMPEFVTLPAPQREPFVVLPEDQREAPPAPGAVPDLSTPELVHYNLANGMEIIAAQTGEVPLATVTLVIQAGSVRDARAKAGIADMAASLAEDGTITRTGEEIAMRLESLGARLSAGARKDATVFTLTAPTQNLLAAGEVFADVIRNPAYRQDEFAREQTRWIEGLQSRMVNPANLARMAIMPALYGDAPYGNQTGGTPQSIAAITRDDLQAYQAATWHPAVSKMVITGGIAPADAIALGQSLFGDWRSDRPAPEPVMERAGQALAPRTIVIDAPQMGQAAVYIAGRGIARDKPGHAALALANAVLGGGSSGRLFDEIRTQRGLSYGSYSNIASLADDPIYIARTQTAHETVGEVVTIMLDALGGFDDAPIDQDWLDKRRLYLTGRHARARETSAGYANIIADLLAFNMPAEDAEQYVQRLEAVDVEAANQIAQKHFDPARATIVVVGRAETFIDELSAIRSGVQVIAQDALDLSSASLTLSP